MDNMETKYTDIIIYACGFLALIMAIVIVVLCRMQVHPSREPFDVLPVQKLSKFPLRRQVQDISKTQWQNMVSDCTLQRILLKKYCSLTCQAQDTKLWLFEMASVQTISRFPAQTRV